VWESTRQLLIKNLKPKSRRFPCQPTESENNAAANLDYCVRRHHALEPRERPASALTKEREDDRGKQYPNTDHSNGEHFLTARLWPNTRIKSH